MVWIHGGGYFTGGTSDPRYDGALFAEQGDVVLVSIQYRLGALGWLDLDEMGGEEFHHCKNNGLLDQVAALRWVKDNIVNFGGDQDNITIFGESAGGSSVTTLMVLPLAKKLFNKVIAQSGTFDYSRTQIRGRRYTKAFMAACDVDDLNGLMSLSEEKIRNATGKVSADETFMSDWMFGPVFDGDLLPENPYDYIAEGKTSDILLMHGSTKEEYHYWLHYHPKIMCDTPREALLDLFKDGFELTSDNIDRLYQFITEYYPHKIKSDKYIDIATWGFFRYPHSRLSAAQSQHNPTWEYLFEWSSPVDPKMGACHTIDLPFIFNIKLDEIFGGKPPIALIEQVQNAWISFARNGDPNHSTLPVWPPYNKEDKPKMVFKVNPHVENDPDGVLRNKWEEVKG